jgi:hypothetical protein
MGLPHFHGVTASHALASNWSIRFNAFEDAGIPFLVEFLPSTLAHMHIFTFENSWCEFDGFDGFLVTALTADE